MASYFPCPNPACTYQFDADQLPPAAMVTCPLCRTRFPYRKAAPAPAPNDAADSDRGDDRPYSRRPAEEEERRERRPAANRLVNPRFVPKSNKTQTIVFVVGFAAVVATVLLIIMLTMKKNPFQFNGDSSETFTNDEYNYRLRMFSKENWSEDKGVDNRTKINGFGGFVQRRNNTDAYFAFRAMDFKKRNPRPNEMRQFMLSMLKKGFGSSLKAGESFDATIAGQPAAGVRFQGDFDEKQSTGEGFAFHYRGIGYVLMYWADEGSWDQVKPVFDSVVLSFEFLDPDKKFKETESTVPTHHLDSGNYQLSDEDAVWDRAVLKDASKSKFDYIVEEMKDKDENATMAFRFNGKKVRRDFDPRPVPEAVVIELKRNDDPLETVRAYWLKKKEADDGDGKAKLTIDPTKKSPSGMKMPQSEAIVGEFEYLNSEARGDKKFIVIAALNIGDKLIAVVSWCNDKDADILEPYLVHLAASLRERR